MKVWVGSSNFNWGEKHYFGETNLLCIILECYHLSSMVGCWLLVLDS